MPPIRFAYALGACAVLALVLPAAAADPTHRVFPIAVQNGSGESGTVTLTPMGDKTRVDIALVGAPGDTPQPVHVHPGSCAKLDPKPKYPLTSAIDGVSTTTLDVPMAQLTSGDFAVNVHKSTSEIAKYVACADLTKK